MESEHLAQPLKEWVRSTFNLEWQWDWRIQPTTLELYQRTGSMWTLRTPALIKRTYVAYEVQQQ